MNAPSLTPVRPAFLPLAAREARAEIVRAWRTPAFIVPTLLLPIAFYTLFGLLLAPPGTAIAVHAMVTFGVAAALGPSLFGFGAGIAADRDTGLLALKRVSPLPIAALLYARLATAVVYTAVVLLALYGLGGVFGHAALTPARWLALALVHLTSIVPFCLLGLAIGLRTGPSAAMALANIAFLALSMLGGLWLPLRAFPPVMQHLAWLLPSFHVAAVALDVAGLEPAPSLLAHVSYLAAFSAGCLGAIAGAWRHRLR